VNFSAEKFGLAEDAAKETDIRMNTGDGILVERATQANAGVGMTRDLLAPTVSLIDDGAQLRQPCLGEGGVRRQFLVALPRRLQLAPRDAHRLAVDTCEAVEQLELIRGPREPALLATYEAERRPAAERVIMHSRAQLALVRPGPEVTALRLSGRGSWKVELDDGAAIELGRGTPDEVVERTTRFIRTLPQVLHKFDAPLESADLRHAEGYAVKLKGLTVAADAKQPPQASGKQ